MECTEPEAVNQFHHGGVKNEDSLKRSAIFGGGVRKKWKQPEAVGQISQNNANSLRRSPIFGRGARKKCKQPETVGQFHKNMQLA